MARPVCVACQRFYRPKKNGVNVFENKPARNDAPPGRLRPGAWNDYKLWQADLWECPGCGNLMISGFGHEPIREHHHPDWAAEKARLLEAARNGYFSYTVNDC